MERTIVFRVAAIVLGVAFAAAGFAQDTRRPNDVVVAVDVSGSMRSQGVFADVQAYLENDLVRPLLKPGDRFTLIVFGERARAYPTRVIASDADVAAAVDDIRGLQAGEDFTDLGSALEVLDGAMASRSEGDYRPVAVFITDGKNAPPPASPYSGRDLSVDDRFTESGRRIAKKGWLLYVVGLGARNDADVVAAAVEGSKAVGGSSSAAASDGTVGAASGVSGGEDAGGSGGSSGGTGEGGTAEALSAAPLVEYLEETAQVAEERAETAAAEAEAATDERPASSLPLVLAAAGGAVVLIGLLVFIVAVKRRADRKDEPKKPSAKIPLA